MRQLVVSVLFFILAVPALTHAQVAERIDVSAVDVPIVVRDSRGGVPPDLTPRDFRLLEDGVEQEIIGLSYAARPASAPVAATPPEAPTESVQTVAPAQRWEIVVFLQQSFSSTHGLQTALKGLIDRSDELTRMGDVEIVGDAGTAPKTLVQPTADAERLRSELRRLADSIKGEDQIVRLRTTFIEEDESALSANPDRGTRSMRAMMAARTEAMIIRQHQDSFLQWLSQRPPTSRPRALLFLTNGYDVDPIDFYGAEQTGTGVGRQTQSDYTSLSSTAAQAELSQAIAAAGWTVLAFAPSWMETASSPLFDVSNSGHGRLSGFIRGRNMDASTPRSINIHPLDPLQTMAHATGGNVETSAVKLGAAIDALSQRLILTYQLHRRRDGRAHRLEVKSRRPGLTVQAQEWIVTGTAEAVAAARASLMTTEDADRGELPVRCVVRDGAAKTRDVVTSQLEVTVDFTPVDALRASLTDATLRFAIAVTSPDAPPFRTAKRLEHVDLSKQVGWKVTFDVQHRPDARIGVVAEELATGVWGGCTCSEASASNSEATAPQPAAVPTPEELDARWTTINAALSLARKQGQLVLLYARPVAGKLAKESDQWLEDAMKKEAFRHALQGLVLARETAHSEDFAYIGLDDIRTNLRGSDTALLLVVDPRGALIARPASAFRDVGQFALDLNALRQQTAAFLEASKLRGGGREAEADLLSAAALFDAGYVDAATARYRVVIDESEAAHDDITKQKAQLGLATLMLQTGRRRDALDQLDNLTRRPASPEIGASAWMVIGHTRRENREDSYAITAYQNAWKLAQKPSVIADAARHFLEMLGAVPAGEKSAAKRGTVVLHYPHRDVMLGNIDFIATAPSGTSRVEFFLDDARVNEVTRAPFRARIQLGATPRLHTVRAVAYDDADRELAQAAVRLNDVVESLGVRIISPTTDEIESRTTVEVEPRLPQGEELQSVDLFWNEEKFATLRSAPFRYDFALPAPHAVGYLRAVLNAKSGASAEDVRVLNVEGGTATARVDAVQIHALVEDRSGHHVEGLKGSDFDVREDGKAVRVNVESTPNDPITIGLVLDTSASMRRVMVDVVDYAHEFVNTSLLPMDKTFVVAFDERPRLVQPVTNDRTRVSASIFDVQASGGTALWGATLYSLQQFTAVKGKRALVIFTDGENTAGAASPRAALQYAHEVGVPIYVVELFTGQRSAMTATMPSMPFTHDVTPNTSESNLQAMAESTGGAFFRYARKKDLPRLFTQIRDDARGQYLLTYVSPSTKPLDEMRKVSVGVRGRSVVVRATSGYYPH